MSKLFVKSSKQFRLAPLTAAILSSFALVGNVAYAADEKADSGSKADDTVEEVVSLGSRSSRARTASDSTVPIDSFSSEKFEAVGNTADVTDNLRALIPSYTATPATGDGSAFVRPTSMRGMASDQTLILINGKRRHRSALVQFFAPAAGNGAHAPDVGMIPSIALKRVDVLRDGASSQYGSDAIAGVMNFVLKDDSDGGSVTAQYGQYYEGEQSYKIAINKGLELGETGFLNLSAEYVDNDALSRGLQRPDAQALIDAGVEGVGADSPFGDSPYAQTWGRPENSALRTMFNGAFDLNDEIEMYFQGNYAETDGTYRFFYRPGDNPSTSANEAHSTLQSLQAQGLTGNIINTGYTPYLTGSQQDISLVTGLRGEAYGGWAYDYSVAYGSNKLDYFLYNTTNPSLGLDSNGNIAQRNFDVGGYKQSEVNVNADFSKMFMDVVNFAYGFEWRQETYESLVGEVNSYTGDGSNGLGGISPENAGSFSRNNVAAYIETEADLSDDWLVQTALRYENFSDFGTTVNGKFASRYNVTEDTAIRGAVSSGFHAPTPGQANVTTTITTFDGSTGQQVEEGLVSPTSDAALSVGGAALKEEQSVNLSLGFTSDVTDDATLTVDVYKIDVTDRIYRTGDITTPDGKQISFFTNALDVRSTGIDLVYTNSLETGFIPQTDVVLAFNYNKLEVTDVADVGGNTPVSEATVEDIENNYPRMRANLSTFTHFSEKWTLMARANYYGSHYDERGRIGAATNPSAKIEDIIYIDMEVAYRIQPDLKLVFGGSNIFNSFIGEIDAPYANRQSVGLQYPRRSAANYEGGSWYFAVNYEF